MVSSFTAIGQTLRFVLCFMLMGSVFGCAGMDAGYVSRVLLKRDSNTDDYLWKRSAELVPPVSTTPLAEQIDQKTVSNAFQAEPDIDDLERYLEEGNTLALLVMKNGSLIYSWYGNGHSQGKPAAAFSISKSLISLITARAVAMGHIESFSSPVTTYVPELLNADQRFEQITLQDLIDMRSGIGYSEKVSFPWVNQDAPAVYYASDLAATVISRSKIIAPPGTFLYNDYAPNIVGLALEKATGTPLVTGPMQLLWSDLQAEYTALWSVDQKEFAWHESGLVITARDLLRIGNLMLNDGRIDDRQVAPAAWVSQSLATDDRDSATRFGNLNVGYKNGWWTAKRATGPNDIFSMGRHGQILLISPSNETVIVRLGRDGNPESNIELTERFRRIANGISR